MRLLLVVVMLPVIDYFISNEPHGKTGQMINVAIHHTFICVLSDLPKGNHIQDANLRFVLVAAPLVPILERSQSWY